MSAGKVASIEVGGVESDQFRKVSNPPITRWQWLAYSQSPQAHRMLLVFVSYHACFKEAIKCVNSQTSMY